MSNLSTVAEYIYFKNSTLPSTVAEMLEVGAAREIRDVLGFGSSSTNPDLQNELKEEGLMMTDNLANDTSTDHLIGSIAEYGTSFPTTAVNFIVDSVFENVSRSIQIISEETSSETFGYTSEETNDTFIGNLTAMNSTLSEDGKKHLALRDLMLIGAAVLICVVLLFAQFIHMMHKSSSDESEEACCPSQVVAKYRARYPKIDEEEEETEFGATVSDSNPVGEQDGGEVRKTEALVACSPSKQKKHKNYTPLPTAWDFDGKIVAQIGNEEMTTNDVAKDSETQTISDEIENAMTPEQLDQLKEECKDFEFMDA